MISNTEAVRITLAEAVRITAAADVSGSISRQDTKEILWLVFVGSIQLPEDNEQLNK